MFINNLNEKLKCEIFYIFARGFPDITMRKTPLKIRIRKVKDVHLWVLTFPGRCYWAFRRSGIWQCVTEFPVLQRSVLPSSFRGSRRFRTLCSETSAYKIQTPGNYPEESIQHSEHSGSLKSRIRSYW